MNVTQVFGSIYLFSGILKKKTPNVTYPIIHISHIKLFINDLDIDEFKNVLPIDKMTFSEQFLIQVFLFASCKMMMITAH